MIDVDKLSPEHTEPHPPWSLDEPLRAPFPAFGGKSRAASLVWDRFGQVVNYVEPFANSAAVLLACPEDIQPRVETLNDINCFIANFWRATAWDPEAVARWADWPVLEVDLHSRHRWLLRMARLLRARLEADPSYYDARVAGWWVWGASAWIGTGWCEERDKPSLKIPDFGGGRLHGEGHTKHGKGIHGLGMRSPSAQLPDLGGSTDTGGATPAFGRGVHALGAREPSRKLPGVGGDGNNGARGKGVHGMGMRKQLPSLGAFGPIGEEAHGERGVHGRMLRSPSARLPDLSGGTQWGTAEPGPRAGRGVHSERARGPSRQLPDIGAKAPEGRTQEGTGRGILSTSNRTRLYDIFAALSARLRYTRVACGDWTRICTPAVTYRHGLTAVFLDPPYDGYEHVYGAAKGGEPLSAKVRAWALENGARDDMRIALCGYEGEHDALEAAGWEVVSWRAKGGYANQGDGSNQNKRRERIWFSPACLRPGARAAKETAHHDDLPLFRGAL